MRQRAGRPRRSRCAAGTASRASASNCYRLPEATCSSCGRRRPCAARGRPASRSASRAAAAHRRLRALRARPAAGSPLARRTGLRPVLHRGPAPPGAVRALRAAAAAGRPARPGRGHLRRVRRDPGLQRLHRVRHRRQALRERTLPAVLAAPPRPRSCWPAATAPSRRAAGRRAGRDHGHRPAPGRAELAAQRRGRGAARRSRGRAAAADPRGAR